MNPRYIEELSWRFAEVYEATVDQILVNLARHFKYYTETGTPPSGAWAYQVQKLAEMGQVNRETEAIILHMMGDADESLRAVLEASILDGLKDAEPALRKAAEKGLLPNAKNIPPVLNPSQTQAFQAYYAQSADKLNLVNTVMLQSTQAAYAATVADIATKMANTQGILNTAAGEVITGVTAWNKATKDAVKKMVDNGITGFIDHGGHHWTPEAYVAMDIRSTMGNTARAAVFERNEEYGNDLYQVSWHNGARPLCYPWQGKVISMSGTAGTTIDGDGNEVQVHTEDEIESFRYGGGLFGVNCGHYPIPFVPEFSRIREPKQNEEENEKEYKESQQQRALERKLRDEKRDLEVMKAQGASEDEIKNQRRRIKQASNDLDEFCYETGRKRRTGRETAPIRATFPDGKGGEVTRFGGGYISATEVPPSKTPIAAVTPVKKTGGSVVENLKNPEHKKNVINYIKNAPENARLAWEKSQDRFKDTAWWTDPHSGKAYYSRNENVCHFRTEDVAFAKSSYQEEYAVWFHEYGHNVDQLAGKIANRNGNAFGAKLYAECEERVIDYYRDVLGGNTNSFDLLVEAQTRTGGMGVGSYFRQVMRGSMSTDEWRAIRSSMLDIGDDVEQWRQVFNQRLSNNPVIIDDAKRMLHDKIKSQAVRDGFIQFVKDNYTIYERSDISDMFCEWCIDTWGRNYNYPFGVGHDYSYWVGMFRTPHESLGTEAFAEMYSAVMTNNKSLPVIKEFFPESFKMFEAMLEEIAKK